jgi:hypothetical protein
MTTRQRSRRFIVGTVALLLVAVGAGSWMLSRSDDTTAAPKSTTSASVPTTSSTSSMPLKAPKASVAEDAQFLTEVSEVDPALTTYERQSGNVALRSLLTDGSAFCAFLNRDRDIDAAMMSVAVGVRQVEPQTHLPLSVTAFNAIDSVALLNLCPSLQTVVPSSDLAKIRKLGAVLEVPSN